MKGEFFADIRSQPAGIGRAASSDILASNVRLVARARTPTESFDREVRLQLNWMLSVELSRAESGVTGIASAAVAATNVPASTTANVRRFIFAILGAQLLILTLVASIA